MLPETLVIVCALLNTVAVLDLVRPESTRGASPGAPDSPRDVKRIAFDQGGLTGRSG